MKNPGKPVFSFRMENTLKYHPVCKNTDILHFAKSPPKAVKSRFFCHLVYPIRVPKGCRNANIRVDFSGEVKKQGLNLEYGELVRELGTSKREIYIAFSGSKV